MDQQRAVGLRLLDLARPFLDQKDHDGLAARLAEEWSPDCLVLLLSNHDYEIVEVAARCLGLTGGMSHARSIAALLRHEEPTVVSAAEIALWNIWFRDGGELARRMLYKIAISLNDGETENIVPILTDLIRQRPTYAEAFHQRAQAQFLQENYAAALKDARRALQFNPLHFSAMALCGHCLSCLGRLEEALNAYREALEIHPSLSDIRTAIQRIRRRLAPAAQPDAPVTAG